MILLLPPCSPRMGAHDRRPSPVDGRPGIVVMAHVPLAPLVVSRSENTAPGADPAGRASRKPSRAQGTRSSRAARRRASRPGRRGHSRRRRRGRRAAPHPAGLRRAARRAPGGKTLRLAFGEPDGSPARGQSLLAATSPSSDETDVVASPTRAVGREPARAGIPRLCRAAGSRSTSPVCVEPAAPKARVVIRGGAGLADARVRREGGEVIVTFDVGAEAVPASPKAAAPSTTSTSRKSPPWR